MVGGTSLVYAPLGMVAILPPGIPPTYTPRVHPACQPRAALLPP